MIDSAKEPTSSDQEAIERPGRYEGLGTVNSARTRRSQSSKLKRPTPVPKRRKHN